MGGRLGNQLFRYACARAIQVKYPEQKIVLDFERITTHREKETDYLSSILDLQITPCEVINNSRPFQQPYNMICVFLKRLNSIIKEIGFETPQAFELRQRLAPFFKNNNIIDADDYSEIHYNGIDDIYIYGCVESERYFKEIIPILKSEFIPKDGIREIYQPFFQKIQKHETVCLSVRKWSHLHPEHDNIMGCCDETYYKKAIEIIIGKIQNPLFIVFSNDIAWAKNMNIFQEINVEYEPDGLTISEKIILMTACKHFVIPNSTFGWWVQYLANNDSKIVIGPDRWNNVCYRNPDLSLDYFITLPRSSE